MEWIFQIPLLRTGPIDFEDSANSGVYADMNTEEILYRLQPPLSLSIATFRFSH